MGGYCAEKLIFKEVSSGAGNDLERATMLAKKLVVEYGMSSLGPIVFGRKESLAFLGYEEYWRDYSEKIAAKIDKEIETIIKNEEKRATEILKKKMGLLKKVAKILIEKETIEKEEFERIIKESGTKKIQIT